LYLGGTYLVGFTAGAKSLKDFHDLSFILFGLFFLVVANIFLYGVNDYFDKDTDAFNEKKGNKEHLLKRVEEKKLRIILWVIFGIFVSLIIYSSSYSIKIILSVFLFLAYFYSAPPLRFKARPFLDFSSNMLYALPGIIGYFQTMQKLPSLLVCSALFFWTSAMHLFSAIPDIESDKKASLKTTAVLLGEKKSLFLCAIFWLSCVSILYTLTKSALVLVGLIYIITPLLLIFYPKYISKVYWFFPYINMGVGFIIFAYFFYKVW